MTTPRCDDNSIQRLQMTSVQLSIYLHLQVNLTLALTAQQIRPDKLASEALGIHHHHLRPDYNNSR